MGWLWFLLSRVPGSSLILLNPFQTNFSYRVKPVSFLLFTRFLQGGKSLSLSIYKNFKGSNQSPFFDLQCFYGSNQSPFFDFQGFYRAQSMSWFTWCLQAINMFLIKKFTGKTFYTFLHGLLSITAEGRGKTENWRKFYFTNPYHVN